jgi:hypothetical protein
MFCAGLITKFFQIYYKFSKLRFSSSYAPKPRMKHRCCYRGGDFSALSDLSVNAFKQAFPLFFSVRYEILLLRIICYLVSQFYEHFFSNFQPKILFFRYKMSFKLSFCVGRYEKSFHFFSFRHFRLRLSLSEFELVVGSAAFN